MDQLRPDIFLKQADRIDTDIEILTTTLFKLKGEKRIAMHFRFWENYLIEDIAQMIGRSWDYTDKLIEETISELKKDFFEARKKIT